MNKQKTEAMWLGRDKSSTAEHQNLKWVRQIKLLGVYFRSDIRTYHVEDNWCDKIERMKRIIKQWSRKKLSIYGKILITKTFIISQFMYLMQSVGLPEAILNSINRIILGKKETQQKESV